jgi:AcrR family transcriptional regulator
MTTEEKILFAAEQEFILNGYDGARMQAIADNAGINKAMLHYYFRSKEILFEKIFEEKINLVFPAMGEKLSLKNSFLEKLDVFIDEYFELLIKLPFLPLFVLTNINKTENSKFLKKLPINYLKEFFLNSFFESQQRNEIKDVNPFQFAFSVMGMIVFPFAAKPALMKFSGMDTKDFDELMLSRKEEIKLYVRLILVPR